MIEDIPGFHAELDRLMPGNVSQLLDACVHVEGPGAGEHAALQRADLTGGGIEEGLAREWRRAIRGHAAAVLSDDRRGCDVRPVPGHPEADYLIELRPG